MFLVEEGPRSMARRYIVVITFERDALTGRAYGNVPVVAKPPGTAAPSVIWGFALPGETRLMWDETSYGLYATHASPEPGRPIHIDAEAYPAVPCQLYRFDGARLCRLQPSMSARGRYELTNSAPSSVTAGLTQPRSINGETLRVPLNAIVLPTGLNAEFAPAPRIYVWLAPAAAPGTVVRRIPENVTIVSLDENRTCLSLRYDSGTSSFVEGPCPPLGADG
ncbi:MAG TPA: hypothetical protein VGC72_17685 [Candidatus Elarobacter sp.]